jgi:C-terminal processing protease CtpA/Prc
LQIEDFDFPFDKRFKRLPAMKGLAFEIFEIYTPSGRKYKKPKLTADVVILNNKYPKEYNKLVKFIKKHSEKKIKEE